MSSYGGVVGGVGLVLLLVLCFFPGLPAALYVIGGAFLLVGLTSMVRDIDREEGHD
ncbi:hypothetical protein M3147_16440 [Agromyces mediolanus]|uniref:hypothetical protein n=1 Tax=Agromyces mediolanus TaxID=41986 RepID=UPI002040B11F|nr:hypothetical protein [Agromyces mediolanus]MCM3658846.1 hypothetical protein [Agromyces mediolanus]